MRLSQLLLSSAGLFVFNSLGFCQLRNEVQLSTFSSRLFNPVSVEVQVLGKDLTFVAQNNSWYPYQLELEFSNFVNLIPFMNNYKTVIYPGKTTLFRVSVKEPNAPHDYSYRTRFSIGDPHKKPDQNFNYLVPLTAGKDVRWKGPGVGADGIFFRNTFTLNQGDSLLCMRKGMVTTIPASGQRFDRITRGASIEVMHADGTIATYSISESDHVLVTPGQNVFPLQPLAVSEGEEVLSVSVFQLNEDAALQSFHFKYEPETLEGEEQDSMVVRHDSETIAKELTSKEKKKMAKGELFK